MRKLKEVKNWDMVKKVFPDGVFFDDSSISRFLCPKCENITPLSKRDLANKNLKECSHCETEIPKNVYHNICDYREIRDEKDRKVLIKSKKPLTIYEKVYKFETDKDRVYLKLLELDILVFKSNVEEDHFTTFDSGNSRLMNKVYNIVLKELNFFKDYPLFLENITVGYDGNLSEKPFEINDSAFEEILLLIEKNKESIDWEFFLSSPSMYKYIDKYAGGIYRTHYRYFHSGIVNKKTFLKEIAKNELKDKEDLIIYLEKAFEEGSDVIQFAQYLRNIFPSRDYILSSFPSHKPTKDNEKELKDTFSYLFSNLPAEKLDHYYVRRIYNDILSNQYSLNELKWYLKDHETNLSSLSVELVEIKELLTNAGIEINEYTLRKKMIGLVVSSRKIKRMYPEEKATKIIDLIDDDPFKALSLMKTKRELTKKERKDYQ